MSASLRPRAVRRVLGLLCALVVGYAAAPTASAAGPGEPAPPPADLDDHTTPPPRLAPEIIPGLPPMVGTAPTARGLEYRRLTPIEEAERRAADPVFRWLVAQIDAGVADTRIMRRYYWLKQRLDSFDEVLDSGWRAAALERMRQPMPAPPAGPRGGVDAGVLPVVGRWVNIGPTTIPGRVTGLSYVPGRDDWLLAAMADGGPWISRDRGQTWEPLGDLQATQASGAIAADPRDPSTIYWATGEGNAAGDNYSGIGVLTSFDGGRTWRESLPFSSAFRCIVPDPVVPLRIWACGDAGIYRSDDGAASFSLVEGGLPTDAGGTRLVFRPDDPSIVFATIWNRGLYRSDDGGASWTQVEGGLPLAGMGRNDVAICESNPDVMALVDAIDGGDVWRSTDGGLTWAQTPGDPDHCGGQCWYDQVVGIAPDDCDTIYANGIGFRVSRDGGATWQGTASSIHVDHHAILTRPGGEVIVGDDGGIYLSTNFGQSFTSISQGLPSTQYYGACGHDTDPNRIAGGTQDRGSHRSVGSSWELVLGGDGGMCALGGTKMLGEFQNTNLQRSTSSGAPGTFVSAMAGINLSDPRAWVGIIEKDPADPNTLYVGTSRVYRTTDFVATPWEEILAPVYFGRLISALAVSPVDRQVLWAGFELGGLYRSTDALAANPSFTDVKGSLPTRTVRRIVPHPADADAAWIIHSGTGNPRIWFTSDGGASYTDVTGDLPPVQVNDMVVDPGDTDIWIAATDLGIYRTTDGGATWSSFSDGFPTAAAVELFRHPADGTLIAATHGRSMFSFRPAAATPTAVPDGKAVAGEPMRAEKTSGGDLWLRFDTLACTAERYHLFHGRLAEVATGSYDGAVCDLNRGGETVLPMPGAPGESVYFLVAAANGAGAEGPHGFRSDGTVRPHSGVGMCGVASHEPNATCP